MVRNRILGFGSKGPDVVNLQRLLNHHLGSPRRPLVPDGIFGPLTRGRVIEFQTLNRLWPVQMPPPPEAYGLPRKALVIDGIVGPNTLRVLLDIRVVAPTKSQFAPVDQDRRVSSAKPSRLVQVRESDADSTIPVSDPTPPKPPVLIQQVTLQAGTQAAVNPWVFSPFVFTGQATLLAKNEGKPDFLLTAGGQIGLNTGSANGSWTGQGFLQMGVGGFDSLKLGPLDLLNPFWQVMLQKNQGQDATIGTALGNQINWALSKKIVNGQEVDVVDIFFNSQAVVNISLRDGTCSAPSGQFLLGASYTFSR
jgi:peptidoglycan hydrolase-like protein with peptidoglycan-binding domain